MRKQITVELVVYSNTRKNLTECIWINSFLIQLRVLNRNTWCHLTICKQMRSSLFKNCYQQTLRKQIMYLRYMHQNDLALNNLQRLICQKAQPTNQPTNQQVNQPINLYPLQRYNTVKSEIKSSNLSLCWQRVFS